MAADFRIGKLFHLTPLVDDLAAAEFFFDTVFSPLCMMRNYSSHWHRDAAIYVVAEASIEPMQCYPPREGEEASSWFRYQDRFGPRVHNTAFYVDDVAAIDRRLVEAGVRTTNGGTDDSGTTFTHPKDVPGMLEFHEPIHWGGRDPRFSDAFAAFAADYWGNRHPLGVQRLSHITTVVRDAPAAKSFFVDVLDAMPLDDQPSTFADATAAYVLVGEETVMELAQPTAPTSPIAADLERVGEGVVGLTFTVRDLEPATEHLALFDAPVLAATDRDIRLDPSKTWSCEYRFTTDVLRGDPRPG
jgi:catechol 2,3-dioxygenase-like lactoylglutathione lyase family enzyme